MRVVTRQWQLPGTGIAFQQFRHSHCIRCLLQLFPLRTLPVNPSKFFSSSSSSRFTSIVHPGRADCRQLRMAARKMEITTIALVLAMMMTMLAAKAVAQNNGCSSVMMALSPCLDFIRSKAMEPGFSCCTTLGGIVQTDPRCLCMVLDGSAASFGITINHTRALELPGICKFQAPSSSQCTGMSLL
uniref:Uncharacterized protein n=1 Tax=Avena sativa TaxID=4498 RepID=A0ACD5UMK1_AVESA